MGRTPDGQRPAADCGPEVRDASMGPMTGLAGIGLATFVWSFGVLGQTGGTLRCGSQLVRSGETVLALKAACGEPNQVDTRNLTRILRLPNGTERRTLVQVEEWIYRGGAGSLARIVRIRNGRIFSVDTLDIRTDEKTSGRDKDRCRRQLFREGRTTLGELRLTCGPPDQSDRWYEEVIGRIGYIERGRLITYDRYTYSFGSNHLLRVFTFANGTLIDQARGPRARAP